MTDEKCVVKEVDHLATIMIWWLLRFLIKWLLILIVVFTAVILNLFIWEHLLEFRNQLKCPFFCVTGSTNAYLHTFADHKCCDRSLVNYNIQAVVSILIMCVFSLCIAQNKCLVNMTSLANVWSEGWDLLWRFSLRHYSVLLLMLYTLIVFCILISTDY